ncbi:hypothetical protein HPB49_002038 [Dermacentor silvarum]|uniref:Uncharacterized protein n=1 Tax=Dermacentor silvarum TaxID=543639 RepID=A0ACB8CCU6_DERSI|nr:hypothetical protein HPB49_002038 [Dermacentor silvarum]
MAPEQSGFRRLRAAADSLADVVSTLEEPKHRGDVSYLVLLDLVSPFDRLPHDTIIDALSAMRVSGRFLVYLGAFLSGRTMRVRVGGVLSQPRAIPCLTLRGTALPWRRRVRYLGLLVDRLLSWQPAVAALRKVNRGVASAARSLSARGHGCSPTLALRIYNSVASARVLYGLPLADLHPSKWDAVDADHQAVAGEIPVSLRAEVRALNHIGRMYRSRHGQQLVERFRSLPNSGILVAATAMRRGRVPCTRWARANQGGEFGDASPHAGVGQGVNKSGAILRRIWKAQELSDDGSMIRVQCPSLRWVKVSKWQAVQDSRRGHRVVHPQGEGRRTALALSDGREASSNKCCPLVRIQISADHHHPYNRLKQGPQHRMGEGDFGLEAEVMFGTSSSLHTPARAARGAKAPHVSALQAPS